MRRHINLTDEDEELLAKVSAKLKATEGEINLTGIYRKALRSLDRELTAKK